jgi:tRNA(Ile2) C34 agmatinyltransferase TiaS
VRHVRRTEAALGQPLDQDTYELIDYRQAMR